MTYVSCLFYFNCLSYFNCLPYLNASNIKVNVICLVKSFLTILRKLNKIHSISVLLTVS